MHFCYVWLRKLMGKDFPGLEQVTTRLTEELTGNETAERNLAYLGRTQETEFYARQASILLGNNACRSGHDRSPTVKAFFALSRERSDI